jgi:hypothetical protein
MPKSAIFPGLFLQHFKSLSIRTATSAVTTEAPQRHKPGGAGSIEGRRPIGMNTDAPVAAEVQSFIRRISEIIATSCSGRNGEFEFSELSFSEW